MIIRAPWRLTSLVLGLVLTSFTSPDVALTSNEQDPFHSHNARAYSELEKRQCMLNEIAPSPQELAAAANASFERIIAATCPNCSELERRAKRAEWLEAADLASQVTGSTRCEIPGTQNLLVPMLMEIRQTPGVTGRPWPLKELAIGGVHASCFQATSEQVGDGNALGIILINTGLMNLSSLNAKILFRGIAVEHVDSDSTKLDFSRATILRRLLSDPALQQMYVGGLLSYYFPGMLPDAPLPRDPILVNMHTVLYQGAELFIVAHEVAHILLGHTAAAAMGAVELATPDGSAGRLGPANSASRELAADALGTQLFLEALSARRNPQSGLAAWGPVFFLSWLAGAEHFGETLFGYRPATHPAATTRRDGIVPTIRASTIADPQFEGLVTETFDALWSSISSRVSSQRDSVLADLDSPKCVRVSTSDPYGLGASALSDLKDLGLSSHEAEDLVSRVLLPRLARASNEIEMYRPSGAVDLEKAKAQFVEGVERSLRKFLERVSGLATTYQQAGQPLVEAWAMAVEEICPVYPFCA